MMARLAFAAASACLLAVCGCSPNHVGHLSLSQSTISFANTLLGTQRGLTITLTNSGNAALALGKISLSGPGQASFKVSSQCGSSLAISASCKVEVVFAPADAGTMTASMSIVEDGSNLPQTVAITGTGSADAMVDVIVYSATPSGIMAAIEAALHGKQAVILEPTGHIGGESANGLGASDEYSDLAIEGLPQTFFNQVYAYYGQSTASRNGRFFEPHVAEQIFQSLLAQHGNITVLTGKALASVEMTGTTIDSVTTTDGLAYHAREYIDASYTGDVMAEANVSYTVGRESSAEYGESYGGVGIPYRVRGTNIDSYLVPKDPSSGLIPHVSPDTLGAPGDADSAVMAYNYRLCVSSDPNNQIPFTAPANYDPAEFELLVRLFTTVVAPKKLTDLVGLTALPNKKFDMNSNAPLSTDEMGPSFGYPNGTATQREQIADEQKRYEQAFLYFIGNDPHVPAAIRAEVNALGLCKDEFTDNGGWPRQIYVREARRMQGAYILTQHDLLLETTVPDSIGLGGYPMDDHINYIVNHDGLAYYEVRGGSFPKLYPISYRALTPQAGEATNLLVPVDVSASHVGFDSLRVEVTYMIMGRAAGAAASLAIDENASVQNVDYGVLSKTLTGDGAVLAPK